MPRQLAFALFLTFSTTSLCPPLAVAQDAGLPEHPRVREAPLPAWAGELDLPSILLEPRKEGEATTQIYGETQYYVPREGPPSRLVQELYRVEKQTGTEELSTWSLVFNPSYERLSVHHVAVLRKGDWQDRIAPSRWSIAHREQRLESRIYDERLSLVLILDDLRIGDILRVSYSVEGKSALLGDDYVGSTSFVLSQMTRRRVVRIQSQKEIDYRLLGGAPEPTSDQMTRGWREILWRIDDLETVDTEGAIPPHYSESAWVQYSTFDNWKDIVDWGRGLFGVPDEPLSELDAVARRLADKSTAEKVIGARNWVQREIRYFAVSVGQHSHRPHPPSETLERRYGDCKDKTVLLLALLKRLGLEAWPVLVDTDWGRGVRQFLPSPYSFNHVIVAVQADGKDWWIDPTVSHQGGAELEQLVVPSYGAGLPLVDGAQGLVDPPAHQASLNRKETFFHYRLEEDLKGYEVDIKTSFLGRQAESVRYDLDVSSREELQETYLDFYSEDDLEIGVWKPLFVSDERKANRVDIEEYYKARREGDINGWSFFTLPLEMRNLLPYPSEDRRAPLALPYPMEREEVISLSTGKRELWEPVSEQIDNPWFHFQVSSAVDDTLNSFLLTYTLTLKADEVAAEDLESYRRDVESFNDSFGYAMGGYVEEPELLETGVPAIGVGLLAGAVGALALLIFLWRLRIGERGALTYLTRPTTRPLGEGWHGGLLFRSAKGRILAASIVLAAIALCGPFILFFYGLNFLAVGGLLPATARGVTEVSFGLVYLFYLLLSLLAAPLFLRAQRALLRNLKALGVDKLEYDVGWSTWSWFIPLVSLFVAPASFGQIAEGAGKPPERAPLRRLIRCWWGLWVLGQLVLAINGLVEDAGPTIRGLGAGAFTLGNVLMSLAAICAILVLRTLSESVAQATYAAAAAEARGEASAENPNALGEMLYPSAPPVVDSTPAPPPLPPPLPG
ncbi:MAG: DUF3857 domain-containing protein [Acidobacteriota bacterium]